LSLAGELTTPMTPCLIGLGSNLGNRAENLNTAVSHLAQLHGTDVVSVSDFYASHPVGGPADQGEFLNGAALIKTALSPHELLVELRNIERHGGRDRHARWAARTLDLDLLLYGDQCVETTSLVVPHPWLALRRFVLKPAAEIAPDLIHPHIGWSIGQLARHLDEAPRYVACMGSCRSEISYVVQQVAQQLGCGACTDIEVPAAPGAADASNRPGLTASQRLELLRRRTARLLDASQLRSGTTRSSNAGGSTEAWLISDFWLDELMGKSSQGEEEIEREISDLWWQTSMIPEIQPAALVVCQLDSARSALEASSTLERVRRPGQGPFLILEGAEANEETLERWIHDLAAVVLAMN
jgi:2-amino-4-hydroxy-6-hydroxymethyldihydropteridine diphosphokinase